MLGEIENGVFTLKTHQMFSVHKKTGNRRSFLDLCLSKTLAAKSHDLN